MSAAENIHEQRAARYLQNRGLAVIARNFRCRSGEIDLVCRDAEELVFVEVRFRSNTRYASAAESVTPAKQRKLIRAAQVFLLKYPRYAELSCRFDVVAMSPATSKQGEDHVQWLAHAFTA